MTGPFDSFVILAEMRTGSNYLEASLNDLDGVSCLGELFNPHFIGGPGQDAALGVDRAAREADPGSLLEVVRAQPGLAGFRYFHDHDPRVLPRVLSDPRVAKIVLTRNPVESYVSLKIAGQTGQWRLTNVRHHKAARVAFDGAEFEEHVAALQQFQLEILRGLQVTGQTAFWIAYEDLGEIEVLNGLAAFLGVAARLKAPNGKLKKQNPEPVEDRLTNPEALGEALARLDRFNLARTPNFEPRRGPAVPSFVATPGAGLMYLPIRCGPEDAVLDWMAAVDGVGREGLLSGLNQPALRRWQAEHPRSRRFSVLRHPLARAHAAFCDTILTGMFGRIRQRLINYHEIPLPDPKDLSGYDAEAHRAAFAGFLGFLRANLSGQTSERVDPAWASQGAVLRGMAQVALPDRVLREEEMAAGLASLAAEIGITPPPVPTPAPPGTGPVPLSAIVDDEIERLARDAYVRDYEEFGFGAWRATGVGA